MANEDRIKDSIRQDVLTRASYLSPTSDEYWSIVAEAAVESVLYDILDLAKRAGTVFPDDAD